MNDTDEGSFSRAERENAKTESEDKFCSYLDRNRRGHRTHVRVSWSFGPVDDASGILPM